MKERFTAYPLRLIALIWAVGIILICLLLTFGPADAFLPAAQKEDILEAGDLSEDELSDGKTAAAEKAVGTKDREEEEELSDGGPEYQDKKKASALQIGAICGAMTLMLACGLFLWGSASPYAALYIVLFYVIAALPMLHGLLFALCIMVDHTAWMLWVFRMPHLRRRIGTIGFPEGFSKSGKMARFNGKEYFLLALNSFLIISGWCLIHYFGGVENIDFVTFIVPSFYLIGLLAVIHILVLVRLYRGNRYTTSRMAIAGAFFFSFACILNKQDLYYAAGLVLILAFFIYYLVMDEPGMLDFMDRSLVKAGTPERQLAGENLKYRRRFFTVCILAIFPTIYFAAAGIARYRTFGASNFDLGIFSQMFEYMARTGLPLTTTERGHLLSHMYVHFSPIYYLFMPVYMVFRSTESLLVIQAVMVFAGVIPLFLICRHYRLKPIMTFLVSCIYLLLPAIGQPLFFDFHENKFIPFFVLWFIWFYLEKKDKRAFLFLILSLMIKEDTPIFLMVFAIYRMVGKKEYKRGGLLLAVSAVYFAVVMIIIGRGGEGLVEGHYSMYYLEGESGLFALAKNIILEPGRFLAQVFDRENLGYIFCTLGVLLFVPLACRDKRRLILLIPYVAFALMTAYPSQHNVGFQYTYGPAVLMLLLFVMNLSEMDKSLQYVICLTSVCACLLMTYAYRGAESYRYFTDYVENREKYVEEEAFLENIPEDADVTADGLIVPHLSHVHELYEFDSDAKTFDKTDYYILLKDQPYYRYRRFKREYKDMGYQLEETVGDLLIYQKE